MPKLWHRTFHSLHLGGIMATSHPFGVGDAAEQHDNLAVQVAFEEAAKFDTLNRTGVIGIVSALFVRARTNLLLARYEQRWGPFAHNQSAVFAEDTAE